MWDLKIKRRWAMGYSWVVVCERRAHGSLMDREFSFTFNSEYKAQEFKRKVAKGDIDPATHVGGY